MLFDLVLIVFINIKLGYESKRYNNAAQLLRIAMMALRNFYKLMVWNYALISILENKPFNFETK
jgi:hypothetical protein